MKRKIALILALAMCLLCCGCGKKAEQTPTQKAEETAAAATQPTQTVPEETEETKPELLDISLSAEHAGDVTQEQMDAAMAEGKVQFAKRYDSGSVVYRVTAQQHDAIMEKVRAAVDAELERMLTGGEYSFTGIQPEDNYSRFTVTTEQTELSMLDSFSVLEFYMYGQLYQAYNGTPDQAITVEFVNADSGEVLETASSADMK